MNYLLIATIVVGFVALVLVAISLRRATLTFVKFRGQRIVSCPETHQPAAIRVTAGKAALEAAVGHEALNVCACSRWPEKQDCPQDCLAQVKEAPAACLVWNIMNRWYEGQSCAYCQKPFTQVHWHDHPPALVGEDRKTIQWNEVKPEELQETMRTHLPVCWNCHIAETFRREHPELVTDRPVH
ncbi:MAG TPA: hypothetical protein VLW46_01305 [Candidatus Bathyarchaeia archaeon]|nr:hypothetical protein [Candidatus Bathyarchaeia archaeon]